MESIKTWSKRAKCRFITSPDFVTGNRRGTKAAKRICTGLDENGILCPVLDLCKTYAIAHDEKGVWGGTSHTERSKLPEAFKTACREIYYLYGLLEYRQGVVARFLERKQGLLLEQTDPNDTQQVDLDANQDLASAT